MDRRVAVVVAWLTGVSVTASGLINLSRDPAWIATVACTAGLLGGTAAYCTLMGRYHLLRVLKDVVYDALVWWNVAPKDLADLPPERSIRWVLSNHIFPRHTREAWLIGSASAAVLVLMTIWAMSNP